MDPRWSTCALCPRLCRTACPVATGAAREAAVPSFIAAVLAEWELGRVDESLAREVATLCTDCGACQERCHLHRPLPEYLAAARRSLIDPPAIAPLQPIEGDGEIVAIEADSRPLAQALAQVLGQPIARWRTTDRLGVAAIEHSVWEHRKTHLREAVGSRQVVLVDGGVAEALSSAGVGFSWLHEFDRSLTVGSGSCRSGGDRPLACCGAAGPLAAHHPEDAARVGRLWLERADDWRVVDGRCRNHLRDCGGQATDSLDELLERLGLAAS